MLAEQTMEKLTAMRLHGMANAFRQWLDQAKGKDIAPADLLGMLADAARGRICWSCSRTATASPRRS